MQEEQNIIFVFYSMSVMAHVCAKILKSSDISGSDFRPHNTVYCSVNGIHSLIFGFTYVC